MAYCASPASTSSAGSAALGAGEAQYAIVDAQALQHALLRASGAHGQLCGFELQRFPWAYTVALVHDELRNVPIDLRRVGYVTRSEEHTSELQSRENLVCRL